LYLHKCQCKQFYNFETCKLAELKFSLEMMQVVLITDGQQAMMLPMTPTYSIRGEMKLQNAHQRACKKQSPSYIIWVADRIFMHRIIGHQNSDS
jgi:hypothetical protein